MLNKPATKERHLLVRCVRKVQRDNLLAFDQDVIRWRIDQRCGVVLCLKLLSYLSPLLKEEVFDQSPIRGSSNYIKRILRILILDEEIALDGVLLQRF